VELPRRLKQRKPRPEYDARRETCKLHLYGKDMEPFAACNPRCGRWPSLTEDGAARSDNQTGSSAEDPNATSCAPWQTRRRRHENASICWSSSR